MRAVFLIALLLSSSGCGKHSLERDLINAAAAGDTVQTRKLLALGANVNCRDTTLDRWTPLMWAVYTGKDQVVQILLEAGANPNIRDANGNTALFYALGRDYQGQNIRALIAAGAQTNAPSK